MSVLVEVQGRLSAAASKSQIIYTFLVRESLNGLLIKFSYTPKVLEDPVRVRELVEFALPQYMEEPQLSKYMERREQVLELHNLLTLSVDDPNGFRGAAHRHTPEQEHWIGFADASPGFWPGHVVAGLWRITISVHAVVTDVCKYELQVYGIEKEGEEGYV